ncbi:MAG: hypothetical protein HY314_02655, partial [Acidobacteria bacterium]|nr:hypothetical protein [Acidobacteriota bacterium]
MDNAFLLKAAHDLDDGIDLTDVREKLWREIELGPEPGYFIRCAMELDPTWYADRCRQYIERKDSRPALRADLIRSLNELGTPES